MPRCRHILTECKEQLFEMYVVVCLQCGLRWEGYNEGRYCKDGSFVKAPKWAARSIRIHREEAGDDV